MTFTTLYDHAYRRDQALEALRGERVRAVNVEFLAQTGWDRSVYLMGRSRGPGTGCGGPGGERGGYGGSIHVNVDRKGKGLTV